MSFKFKFFQLKNDSLSDALSVHSLLLLIIFFSGVFINNAEASAKNSSLFTSHQISLPFKPSQPTLMANVSEHQGEELLVIGSDDNQQRWLLIYAFNHQSLTFEQIDKVSIKPNVIAYDVGEITNNDLQALYLLTEKQLQKYVPPSALNSNNEKAAGHFVNELAVSSIYLTNKIAVLTQKDFIKDINNDGKDDLVLPHFEQVNIWISTCCGKWQQQSLPIKPRVEVFDNGITYHDTKLYFQDLTLDGKSDVVSIEQGLINIYPQVAHGEFSTDKKIIDINKDIHGVFWWDIKEADGKNLDQSNLTHRVVEDFKDVNGDGIVDFIVRFTQSSGVLDKSNDFEFYFGKEKDNQLVFENTFTTSIKSDETLQGIQFIDINNDDKLEVLVSSFSIGLSQIIGALLSGSIDQNVLVFSMNEQQQFDSKPIASNEVELNFSLSSGTNGSPLIKVADVNGDKLKDLLFSEGDKTLKVILANKTGKPFKKSAIKYKTVIPSDASLVEEHDINLDGKSDLVMHYGRLDAPELANKLTVLMAN